MRGAFIHAAAAADTAAIVGAAMRESTGRAVVDLLAHKALEMLQLPDVDDFVGGCEKHCVA